MSAPGWVLAALAGWTVIGVAGTILAIAVGDRQRASRGARWIAGAWLVYLAVLLGVSAVQPEKVLLPGAEECFEKMCISVAGVRTVEEFKGREGGQLVMVGLRIRNAGSETAGVDNLRGYLVDSTGTRWDETRGLSGVPLTTRVSRGIAVQSAPVFRVEGDATLEKLSLVLTRGRSGWGWLTIGNTDSLRHRRTRLRLR